MRPNWQHPDDEPLPPPPDKADVFERFTLGVALLGLAVAAYLTSCVAWGQEAEGPTVELPMMVILENANGTNVVIERRVAPPPIPPLPPIPLRLILSATNSIRTMTNASGDLVVDTRIVIPRHIVQGHRVEPKRHYYGVINSEITYLGEWTSADYEKWAYTGSQATANQPEIVRWNCIIATTNQIALPGLVHVKLCP